VSGPTAPTPPSPSAAASPVSLPDLPGPPDSVRLGYPEELRNADVTTVAAAALPGVMAIVGMTALGGLIGYRQAKAGYVMQAAGAAGFLR
jgi:hypothetical protein